MLMPTPFRRWVSSLDQRYPLMVGAYLLALFTVVAGLIFFPFSGVLMGLLFFLLGSFFLVSLIILSATYLLFAVAVFGAIRRTFFGLVRWCATGVASKSEERQQKPGLAGGRSDLWDKWLDWS